MHLGNAAMLPLDPTVYVRRALNTSPIDFKIPTRREEFEWLANEEDRTNSLRVPKTTPPSILPAGEGGWKPPAVRREQGTGGRALQAADTPASIISARIRRQGYPCDEPRQAKHDRQASRPNVAVWILRCGNAAYRVKLIPDMAARVELVK
jgi:hypothetical protein